MVQSMTAFARAEHQTGIGKVTLELRSVNNRFCDPSFRLSDAVRVLEPGLRDRLLARIKRGRIEVSIRLDSSHASSELMQLSTAQLDSLSTLQQQVQAVMPDSASMSVNEILAWPGVIESGGTDEETLGGVILPLFDELLNEFIKARGREGEKLADVIRQRIENCRGRVLSLRDQLPEIKQYMRDRLESRVAEILDRVDSERIEQELVLLLNKADVEEEIDRLLIHFDEVIDVMKQNQPVGRRLDFLMQELNREANTLGSKAAHTDMTNTSMELKVLIEQMREQVQNLE